MASAKAKFECVDCGWVFKSPQGLGKHRRSFHGVIGSSPASKARHKHKKPRRGRVYRVCVDCMDILMRQRESARNKNKRFDLADHHARCDCACHGPKS